MRVFPKQHLLQWVISYYLILIPDSKLNLMDSKFLVNPIIPQEAFSENFDLKTITLISTLFIYHLKQFNFSDSNCLFAFRFPLIISSTFKHKEKFFSILPIILKTSLVVLIYISFWPYQNAGLLGYIHLIIIGHDLNLFLALFVFYLFTPLFF